MKKFTTNGYRLLLIIIIFLSAARAAQAQYIGANFETGGLYTALAKDAANNLYITRVKPETSGATYEVEKYTNGKGTPAVIYSGLTHEAEDFPWGLAVTSTGNVFISTGFSASTGAIIELVNSGGTYTPSTYQTGRYFTALAVDAADNLYDTEYDANNLTYAVVKYPANSAPGTAGTNLYDNLSSHAGYTYPTGLVVASNGDIYVSDAFSNDPTITDGGHVYKLTAASSYAVSTISSGNYSTALALDGSGDLYSSENRGSGYNLIRYADATGPGVAIFNPLHTNGIYYPWGIAVYGFNNIYLADGDDGTNGGAIIQLSAAPPTVTTNSATLITSTTATLNGQVNDNDRNTTVKFIYGTSPTLAGATSAPATTGGTIAAGTGNTAVALNVTGLTGSTTYYYEVSANSAGGTVKGAILNFLTAPSISYSTPESYDAGVAISPLSPVSSTVPMPAYGGPVVIGSGFKTPFGVAADVSGNVYVADYGNGLIKEIPAGGGPPVTLLSGFTTGIGVAVDAAGNIYVADASNTTINKYLAGTTTPVAIATGFSSPYGIAVDGKGNVYVADYGNSAVYEIPVGGGTQVAIGSGLVNPTGVAVDGAGNVYVADYGSGLVKEILSNGGSTITLGSGFTQPVGVTTDPAGNVFVADYGASAVYELPAGLSTPIAVGSGYTNPTGVAVDGFGKLAVANYLSAVEANDVEQLTPVGGYYLSMPLPAGLVFNETTGVITGTPATIAAAANYTVTAYNTSGGTSTVVNIKVIANAKLSSLKLSNGTLSPAFASGTTSYTANVANSASTITVTPTTSDPAATVTVNGTAVTSGTASGAITLAEGAPTIITTVVTAQDGSTTKTYTVTITRAPSSNANLSKLGPNIGGITPTFSSGTTSYTISTGNASASITLTPVSSDANATIKVNGTAVTSGTTTAPIALAEGGQTVISTVVTAQDGTTMQTYTLTVTRAPSGNATLSNLQLNNGTLTPAFATGTVNYSASVANSVSTITITPTITDANATIKVNGTTVASGTASGAIALAEGAQTVINTVVTAQDGTTTKTYKVTVTRAPSSNATLSKLGPGIGGLTPAFSSGTTSYTISTGNANASMTLTPVSSDANATIQVNGTTVASGATTAPIALNEGGQTVISTVVTAQDGTTTKTYTLTVTRAPSTNATLSNLMPNNGTLSPAFASGTTSYTASEINYISSVTLTPTTTDPNATVKVNGAVVSSGTASAPIPLAEGAQTVITTVVTAQNGTTVKTYTLTVTRAPSTNASLSKLGPSIAGLTPAFSSGTTSYTISTGNATTSMKLTPVSIDANATIKVNGTTVASGTATSPIALAVGANTINTVVTAQDGTTTQTYTLTVTRASGGDDSYLPIAIGTGISVTQPTERPTLDDDIIVVHQGISPNGDGVNDFLVIDGIQAYPDNKLSIMNRNGQLVYETQGYDNSSKVFDGHSNKNGQMQLPGTYFYQLDYTASGITKHKTGFIILKY